MTELKGKIPHHDNRPKILWGLPLYDPHHDGGQYYRQDDFTRPACYELSGRIRSPITCRELVPGKAWLYLSRSDSEKEITRAAVMQLVCETSDGIYLRVIFAGTGVGNPLREMQDVWFGAEQGYVANVPLDVMIQACEALREYYGPER